MLSLVAPLLSAHMNITWFLPPVALIVSLVYSASRWEAPSRIVRHATRLFLMILLGMAIILGVLYALSYNL